MQLGLMYKLHAQCGRGELRKRPSKHLRFFYLMAPAAVAQQAMTRMPLSAPKPDRPLPQLHQGSFYSPTQKKINPKSLPTLRQCQCSDAPGPTSKLPVCTQVRS
jgi:hypothetical protein